MTFDRRKFDVAVRTFGGVKATAIAVLVLVSLPLMVVYLVSDVFGAKVDLFFDLGMLIFILAAGAYIWADLSKVFDRADRILAAEKEEANHG